MMITRAWCFDIKKAIEPGVIFYQRITSFSLGHVFLTAVVELSYHQVPVGIWEIYFSVFARRKENKYEVS